jgi:hypothetical protein
MRRTKQKEASSLDFQPALCSFARELKLYDPGRSMLAKSLSAPALKPSRPTSPIPALLKPIALLDQLELCHTTAAAARSLGLSQPTVSRRQRVLVQDLQLQPVPQRHPHRLRHQPHQGLLLLRRAAQWHRLQAGAWRLGLNPWQGVLLGDCPERSLFGHPLRWLELLQAAVVDGALLSSLDLSLLEPGGWSQPSDGPQPWRGAWLWPLTSHPLGLLLPPGESGVPSWSSVLVPPEFHAPGLAAAVRQRHWQAVAAPKRCLRHQPWAELLSSRAMPLLASSPWAVQLIAQLPGWSWQPLADGARETLWLLTQPQIWQHAEVALEPQLASWRIQLSPDDSTSA